MPAASNRPGLRPGTIIRTAMACAAIATLGFLWILQSLDQQRLTDQRADVLKRIAQVENAAKEDEAMLAELLRAPVLMQRVRQLNLGLTNIAFQQRLFITSAPPAIALQSPSQPRQPGLPMTPIAAATPSPIP
jgi:hypothetical protein